MQLPLYGIGQPGKRKLKTLAIQIARRNLVTQTLQNPSYSFRYECGAFSFGQAGDSVRP
jgi:hypothetical protein